MPTSHDIEDDIVAAIRRVIRAIDLQSRRLLDRYQLTGPQLATLRTADQLGTPAISSLARAVHLSQPTVTGIVNRLERTGLVVRERSQDDKRITVVCTTPAGRDLLARAPSLLQDQFRSELARLEAWERHWLLAALQRIASMMDAEGIDASPYLETGPVVQPLDEGPEGPGDADDEGSDPFGQY